MVNEYIQKQIKKARIKKLADGTYFAEVAGLRGVWANGKTKILAQKELAEVIEEWLLLKVQQKEKVPGFVFPISLRCVQHDA